MVAPFRSCKVQRRANESDVTEGLREVPEEFARERVDLFGQQADVIGAAE